MSEGNTPYDRRADHGKRAALMRLRLAEDKANDLLWLLADVVQASNALAVATELSAAIDGVVNYMRQTPPEGV